MSGMFFFRMFVSMLQLYPHKKISTVRLGCAGCFPFFCDGELLESKPVVGAPLCLETKAGKRNFGLAMQLRLNSSGHLPPLIFAHGSSGDGT